MAGEQSRDTDTPWRQGLVLEHQVAVELGLVLPNSLGQSVAVMATHDCDIVANVSLEPCVEFIVGQHITELGADTNAKTARRLHIAFETGQGAVAVELLAARKVAIPKASALSTKPRPHWALTPEGLLTLQKWLAARYYRSAFSDEFQRRLKATKLDKKIVKALVKPSIHILAVYFDVDGGVENDRKGVDDVYQLRITLLYDSTKDEPVAYEATQNAVDEIESAFEGVLFIDGTWKNIQLVSCSASSDIAMTIAASRELKQWPLDHLSLDADPLQPMLA